MVEIFLKTFIFYFIVIDPIGSAPIFLVVTEHLSIKEKIKTALHGTFIATLILLFFGLLGNSILAYLKISFPAFTIAGGIILFIIPGIIATLMFSQVLYIIAEDKEIDPYNALVKSKQMMEGNKWKLFKILLRILLLAIGCILTLGIGFIWLAPYQNAVYAKFYKVIKEDKHFEARTH